MMRLCIFQTEVDQLLTVGAIKDVTGQVRFVFPLHARKRSNNSGNQSARGSQVLSDMLYRHLANLGTDGWPNKE